MTKYSEEQLSTLRELGIGTDNDEVSTRNAPRTRGSQRKAEPDFSDDSQGGFVASVYQRFNMKRAPEPKPEDE